jgi:hypothetical protein
MEGMWHVLLACWDAGQRQRLAKTCRAARTPCREIYGMDARHEWVTYQTFMNRRSLAGVKRTHVHEDEVPGKFPRGGLSALETLAKRNAIFQQRAE